MRNARRSPPIPALKNWGTFDGRGTSSSSHQRVDAAAAA
jgi:hypothetical protein